MKKIMKILFLMLLLLLLPKISVKAMPMNQENSGYGCYYMCANNSCNEKMVFYTDRIVIDSNAQTFNDPRYITPTNGQPLDLFNSMYEGKNIVGIYNEYHENPNNGVPLLPSASNEFLALENGSGSSMSLETCRQAATVASNMFESGVYYFVVENHEDSYESPQDVLGTYEANRSINDVLVLYGSDFQVLDEGIGDYNNCPLEDKFCVGRELGSDLTYYSSSSDGYGNWGSILDDIYPPGTGTRPAICNSISSEDDMLNCLGCNSSTTLIDQACSSGVYTIGILLEPSTVTSAMEIAVESAETAIFRGTAISSPDSEANAYTWTCEDVKYVTFAYNTLRILAPLLLMIFGSIDFFKAISAPDLKKQQEARSKFPKRIIAFILLIILPFIIGFVFKSFGTHGSNVMTAFCCVATNGNSECSVYNNAINNGSSTSNNSSNVSSTNTSQVDEITSENLCNGSNYLSPTYIETTTAVSTCVNDRYGECISISTSDSVCKCRYTALEISQDLCTRDNCAVGYKGGKCFYNVRKGVSSSTINNIGNLAQIKKVHQSGTTGDYYDGYFDYDMHIKENIPSSVCTGEYNGTPYNCNSNDTNCNCIYGNSIY